MQYVLIDIEGCDRLASGRHKRITIRPTTKIQSVLGTNSSGKSSLLEVGFSPLPPDAAYFPEGGFCRRVIEHKGYKYDLNAKFGEKAQYSFIRDGEELNKSRNVTSQLDLCKEHFGYTREIHQFLLGKLEFTDMGPQQRRDWIAKLSQNDFLFAFNTFKDWRKALTASQNVSKHLKGRLHELREKLMNPDDLVQMRARQEELHETHQMLLREPRYEGVPVNKEAVIRRVAAVEVSIDKWLREDFPTIPTNGTFEELIKETVNAFSTINGVVEAKGQALVVSEQQLRRLEKMVEIDPEELMRRSDELTAASSLVPEPSLDIHYSLLIPADEVISQLRQAVSSIPGEARTPEEISALNGSVYEKRVKLDKAAALLADLQRRIAHIEQCSSVSCPSCNTTFKPGVNEGELEALKERHSNGNRISESLERELNTAEQYLGEAQAAAEAYQRLEEIRRKYHQRYPGLFTYIDQVGGFGLGRRLMNHLAIYAKEAAYSITRQELLANLTAVKAALDQYRNVAGGFLIVKEQYEKDLADYEQSIRHFEQLRDKKNFLISQHESFARYETRYEQLDADYNEVRRLIIDLCNYEGDQLLEETMRKTAVTLGVIDTALSEQAVHEDIIKDCEQQLRISERREKAYAKLVESMSPKSGLIAEQISYQIGSLVDNVNQVIQRVWAYPLYLKVGDISDADVDYKFPFRVDAMDRGDISEGSASVKSIINQSVRLISYPCLGLQGFPLFLDEFGNDFDEVHRHNLTNFIKEMADDDIFSQICMINHNLDGSAALPNSETIILDSRNIQYSHPHNLHVEFA